MAKFIPTLALITAVFAVAWPAQAYVGPGAGVSLLGAAFGLIVAIILAVGVIVLWPLRRFMKARKKGPQDLPASETATASADSD